ncbi:MAG TPA: DASS family sodium-coupled anion symporter, partial [Opitutaceae bacterium]|nr:DASS family sodium-coupled anion symporter [Opitutaceae bacterium]
MAAAADKTQAGMNTPPSPASAPRQLWRAVVPIAFGAAIALWPVPAGLAPNAWYYFAIFAAVIVAIITEPIASAAIGLFGVTLAGILGLPFTAAQLAAPGFKLPVESIKWALSGFSNNAVWLIFGAFMFAMGYEKTGLGRRIALMLVKRLGGRTLGLGYAITLSDLALAPFTPSNTARSAGAIFPVVRSIPELYGSRPGENPRRIGGYLMWVAFASTCVTSSMFITALGPNLLAVELAEKIAGVKITWMQWCLGFLPIGVLLLAAVPWLTYVIYPPELKRSDEVPLWAGQQLAAMGRITGRELVMAALVLLALALWIFGARWVDPTMVVLIAISLMLVCRVVAWEDILENKAGWNVLTWFATLVVLADGLNKVGFVGWFGRNAAALLAGHSPLVVM